MIRIIITLIFGITWCRFKLCPGGYIENGDLICPLCKRVISHRNKEWKMKKEENVVKKETL